MTPGMLAPPGNGSCRVLRKILLAHSLPAATGRGHPPRTHRPSVTDTGSPQDRFVGMNVFRTTGFGVAQYENARLAGARRIACPRAGFAQALREFRQRALVAGAQPLQHGALLLRALLGVTVQAHLCGVLADLNRRPLPASIFCYNYDPNQKISQDSDMIWKETLFVASCLLFTSALYAQQRLPVPDFEERTVPRDTSAPQSTGPRADVPITNGDNRALVGTETVLNDLLRLLGLDRGSEEAAIEIRLLQKSTKALEAVHNLCGNTNCNPEIESEIQQ